MVSPIHWDGRISSVSPKPKLPDPRPGDIWWAYNHALDILDPDTKSHPVLVVGGPAVKGGPVTVAPGTTKDGNFPKDKTVHVRPEEIDTGDNTGRLTQLTWFRIGGNETPLNREDLKNRVGRVSDDFLKNVQGLRKQHRRPK